MTAMGPASALRAMDADKTTKMSRTKTAAFDPADLARGTVPPMQPELTLAPSESLQIAAERPMATQPGVASLQVERAKGTAAEIERYLSALRARAKRGDDPRIARLLVEQGLAWERAGDLSRAAELFDEAMKRGPELHPAVRGARRVRLGLREGDSVTLAPILSLLDHEMRLATKEAERADLLVERARLLEAKPGTEEQVLAALRDALTLRPSHGEALRALEAALERAATTSSKKKDEAAAKRFSTELGAHHARLAAAYGGDAELVASYLASGAQILERNGDLVGAEEAYAAALVADGRVGPVREAYKRLLARRGAHARLRDVLAEEAGREHDLARSVRLLFEAARISLEQLADASQAVTLLEAAVARAPTDPAVDLRVLDELVRLLEARGDALGAASARKARILHETEPALRAIEHRRLAANCEESGDLPGAIGALRQACVVEPLHVPTQLALDRLYAAAERHRERVDLWLDEAAKARDPSRRAAAYVRAAHVAEDDLTSPDEALDYLRAAWVTDTTNVDAFDELTRLLLPPNEVRHGVGGGEGRSARALIELFSHAAQTTSEPARKIAYLEKVAALWEDALGEPAHAAEIYARVLALEPTRRFALLAMQRAYERSGDFRKLADAIESEADQSTDAAHAALLRLRAAEIWNTRVGDRDRAIALTHRVLETHPDHPGALRALLKAQEAAGRHEEVVATLRRMIALIKPKDVAETIPLWLEVGEIYRHRLGRLDEAIDAWRSALAVAPRQPVATRELAHALRHRGSWRSVAELEEQIAAASADPTAAGLSWVRAAEVWEGRLGEDERAQNAYAKALELRADDLSAWEGLARLAERRGALRELEAAYRLRIDNEEGAPRLALRFALGELLVRRGDSLEGAEAALDAVLAEQPGNLHALRLAESIHRRTGNDAALSRVLTMMAQAIRDPLAKRGVLWELVRLQEDRVASSPPIAAYLLIYEIDSHDEGALSGIVRLATSRLRQELMQVRDNRPSDGLPNVRGLLAFGLRRQIALGTDAPTKTSLELRLADLLEDSLDSKEVAESLARYRQALTDDPESPTACAGVRRVASMLGDVAAQLQGEEQAAEIAPDVPSRVAHLLRAAELARRGGEAGATLAIELGSKALRSDPDSPQAASMLGELLLARHDARRLVDAYMEASSAAKDPARIVALSREGARLASTQLQNAPVATALLMQAREVARWDADVLVELGDLYRGQHAWAEAARAYQDATDEEHCHAPASLRVHAHNALAGLYEGALDDGPRALEHLRAVCRLSPDDNAAARKLAGLLFEQGDWAGVEACLEALVRTGTLARLEHVEVLLQLAELRDAQGDTKGTETSLRDALRLEPSLDGQPYARLHAFHEKGHEKGGGGEAGFAAALSELAGETNADPRWLVRLGEMEVHRLGKPHEGLQHLRNALAFLPNDVAALLAYGEALLAVGANEDAAKSLRELVTREPSHAGVLSATQTALNAVGRREEALVLEELRAYLGLTDGAAFRSRRLPPTPPRQDTLQDVVLYSHVLPPLARSPILETLAAIADQLGKVLPPDLGAIGLSVRDKHGVRSTHPLRAYVDRAAHALGIGDVDLYIHDSPDQRILVENFDVPALIVPASLRTLPELETAFAIARLVAKVALKAQLVDKLRPAELEDLVYAAVGPYGGPMPRARAGDVEELSRRVQKAVSRKARKQLEEVAPRVSHFDPIRFARAIDQGASRAAYLLTGDLASAIDHLRRYEDVSAADLVREGTTTGDLIRFALTADSATLRRRLGTSWA